MRPRNSTFPLRPPHARALSFADVASLTTRINRAYHSALVCLHLRNKRDAYYSLLHQLAEVSRAHNDHPRSLDYLHQMLQKYTEEGKINEVPHARLPSSTLPPI